MSQPKQDALYLDEEELETYIQKKTGIQLAIIQMVLDAEFEYLKEKGFLEEPATTEEE